MVVLNPKQEQLIGALQGAKGVYDATERRARADFELAKDTAKNPIRKLIAEAVEAGIPMRQIHQKGLGYSQIASLNNFLNPAKALGTEAILAAITQTPSIPVPPVGSAPEAYKPVFRDNKGEVSFEDSTGTTFKVGAMPMGPGIAFVSDTAWDSLSDEAKRLYEAEYPYHLQGKDEFDGYQQGLDPERWDLVK